MKQHFTKPGFAEGLPQEIQDILPPAKFFHVGDRLCLLIAQNGIVYWDIEKGENIPLKSGNNVSPAWMKEEYAEFPGSLFTIRTTIGNIEERSKDAEKN